MKTTLKLSTLLIALVSAFTFSSCLDSDNNSSYPTYSSYVTITGDAMLGYTFYSDFGCILRPTSQSVQEVLPGLSESNVKRAVVAFDLVSETENGKDLVAGQTYDIILRQSYYANYAIPTYNTIDIANNAAAADSLVNKNQYINDVNSNIWAINGYINAEMTLNYDQSKTISANTYYNSEEDVDVEQKTLSLNIYYNSNSTSTNAQVTSVFSFKLPEEVAGNFPNDSINLVLNAITEYGSNELTKVAECKVARKDFYTPMY